MNEEITTHEAADAVEFGAERVESARAIVEAERVMPADFAHNAAIHYAKALRKHPRFADALFDNCDRKMSVCADNDHLREVECDLEETREDIYLSTCGGTLEARCLLSCEIEEAHIEHLKGNAAACVSELYDAVAVLMRMIAVVEGKQRLGKEN